MSRARTLAVLLFAATVAAWAVASVAHVLAWRDDAPGAFPPGFPAFLAVAILTPAAVGLFVALRRPGNQVAWILLAGPLSVAVVMAGDGLARYWGPSSDAGAWGAWLSYFWPVLFAWPVALAFRFPDGRLLSRRWRVPWWIAVGSFGGAFALLGLADTIERDDGTEIPSPLPVHVGPRDRRAALLDLLGRHRRVAGLRCPGAAGPVPGGRAAGAQAGAVAGVRRRACCRCGWAAGR